jgi:hypothetical protein
MAVRTTEALVRAIIEVAATVTDLSPFINAAHNLVDAKCTDIAEANATEVETWLSAHFYAIFDPRASSETAKGVGQTLQSRVDLGLNVTHYGQMAMMIDQTGGLAFWNDQVKTGKAGASVSFTWLGEDYTLTETS